jgi:hypothetical protein
MLQRLNTEFIRRDKSFKWPTFTLMALAGVLAYSLAGNTESIPIVSTAGSLTLFAMLLIIFGSFFAHFHRCGVMHRVHLKLARRHDQLS